MHCRVGNCKVLRGAREHAGQQNQGREERDATASSELLADSHSRKTFGLTMFPLSFKTTMSFHGASHVTCKLGIRK